MQQFTTSDSLEALIPICPSEEEQSRRVYSEELQAEESGVGLEKKRRLGMEQVRALENYFEVENRVEPDRKVKLAEELGLQPRQVAIWFQNRRARWKTKQLDTDFRLLKANYDSLNSDFTSLQQQKQALSTEVEELKRKVERRNSEHYSSPAIPGSAGNNLCSKQSKSGDFKDKMSSSNGIFNEEMGVAYNAELQILSPPEGTCFQNMADQSVTNWFQMEDMRLFSSEEACNIYSVDQPPSLHCYFQH